ncbi:Cof-type HAD-IIB family hydrolase [Robbsia sp. Bb-Pol-6]|uniref:Cof-type HAD-IIB family hydrolase n=1 Tax=Robbsia betulipollinis TaxID=2981849 RepID=A0ABT3ZND4_9BURK|nr:Cof-type HAD-IIB family hydrolase [Robbsia betulipollinis]MCY0388030.1 Cof-type HAD-IIB family hydrolase [Robbsia betulipollinis]
MSPDDHSHPPSAPRSANPTAADRPALRTDQEIRDAGLAPPARRISAVISDIDGTLVRPDKSLAPATVAAVRALQAAGIPFSLASARPPRGLLGYLNELGITAPLAAYNGGNIVSPSLDVLESHPIPAALARRVLDMLEAQGIDAWVFTRGAWQIRRRDGDYVDHEEQTIGYGPTLVERFDDLSSVDKIVGPCVDVAHLAEVDRDMRAALGDALTIGLSQVYYLDITHPDANKGQAVRGIARQLGVPVTEVAVLGDMANDVAMFREAGLAIAMGQAREDVRAHAHAVTLSNADDGVAAAIHALILPRVQRG